MSRTRKDRKSKGGIKRKRSKDLSVPPRGCTMLRTKCLEEYRSMLDQEDLSFIWEVYYIQDDYELELPGPDS